MAVDATATCHFEVFPIQQTSIGEVAFVLEPAVGGHGATRRRRAVALISNGDGFVLLAGGCVVAAATGHPEGGTWVIDAIATAPGHRGAGAGRRLIEALRQAHAGTSLAAAADDDAVGFYRRTGFRAELLPERWPGVNLCCCVVDSADQRTNMPPSAQHDDTHRQWADTP